MYEENAEINERRRKGFSSRIQSPRHLYKESISKEKGIVLYPEFSFKLACLEKFVSDNP